jgi:hypothetical protein
MTMGKAKQQMAKARGAHHHHMQLAPKSNALINTGNN